MDLLSPRHALVYPPQQGMSDTTFLIQTNFDRGTAYGVDVRRMVLPVDQPEAAVASIWEIIDNRGLIPVSDGEFTRSVSFHPEHVLSVQVLS